MQVCVTHHDLAASQCGHAHPIECALKRQTGTTWLIFESGYVREAQEPFRCAFLPDTILSLCEWIKVNGAAQPFEFDLQMLPVRQNIAWKIAA